MNSDELWFRKVEEALLDIDKVTVKVEALIHIGDNKYMKLHYREAINALEQAEIQLQYMHLARRHRA